MDIILDLLLVLNIKINKGWRIAEKLEEDGEVAPPETSNFTLGKFTFNPYNKLMILFNFSEKL